MPGNSLLALLEWMKRNPHLSDWDFIFAMSPATVGSLVEQAQINHIIQGRDVGWEQLSIRVPSSKQTHVLNNYRLTAPSLDWRVASYDNPRVSFSLAAEGGTHIIEDDFYDVLAVSAHDALDGLQVRGRTRFDTESLRLGLDLKRPEAESLEFDVGDSLQERWAGGQQLADFLQTLPEDRGLYALAAVSATSSNPFLQVRGIGARMQTSRVDKQGALVVFAALEHGPLGQYPREDSDFPFLLPDAMAERAPVTFLLSRRLLHRAAYAYAFETMIEGGMIDYRLTPQGVIQRLQATAGKLPVFELEHKGNRYEFKSQRFSVEAWMGDTPLRAEFDEEEVQLNWHSQCDLDFDYKPKGEEGWRGLSGTFEFHLHHRFYFFRPSEQEADGGLLMAQVASPWPEHVEVTLRKGLEGNLPEALREEVNQFVALVLKQALLEGLSRTLTARIPERVLEGVSLAGNNRFVGQDVELPHGLALFGSIASNAQRLRILDQGIRLSPGQTHTFRVESPFASVSWALEGMPGNAGDIGQIDPASGRYSAPPAHALRYRQARVLVVATDNQTRARSTSMLIALPQGITANPQIRVCSFGDQLTFTAGALGGDPQWRVIEQEGSGQVSPSDDGRRCTYTAGWQLDEGAYLLEKIEVKNSETGELTHVHVLVMQEEPLLYLEAGAPKPDGSVQLSASFNGTDFTQKVIWKHHLGDGSLEDTGLYSPPDDGALAYALFTAVLPDTPFGDLEGHLVHPLNQAVQGV